MTQVDAANPLKVGIVGGTGYTGVELLRLLVRHPLVRLETITSRSEQGLKVSDLYPTLRGYTDLKFEEPDVAALAACDVVFFATPHNVAMRLVPELLAAGTRVVDLSADFRLRDAGVVPRGAPRPNLAAEVADALLRGRVAVEARAFVGRQARGVAQGVVGTFVDEVGGERAVPEGEAAPASAAATKPSALSSRVGCAPR